MISPAGIFPTLRPGLSAAPSALLGEQRAGAGAPHRRLQLAHYQGHGQAGQAAHQALGGLHGLGSAPRSASAGAYTLSIHSPNAQK